MLMYESARSPFPDLNCIPEEADDRIMLHVQDIKSTVSEFLLKMTMPFQIIHTYLLKTLKSFM